MAEARLPVMPSPCASVEARAVMIETAAQPLDDATAWAGAAATALNARTPAALARTPAPKRRSLLVEGRMHLLLRTELSMGYEGAPIGDPQCIRSDIW